MITLQALAEAVTQPISAGGLDFKAPNPPDNDMDLDDQREEYLFLKTRLPRDVNIQDAISFGFYEYKNRYWIRRKEDTFEPVSNFTIVVKYLIRGANPKRIVEITNVWGRSEVIDMEIEDLISLEKFKGKVEAQGNYLFEGRPGDLSKIKNKLFDQEKPCIEIPRLGQYKEEFFAFANGLYDGTQWYPVDENGIVHYKGQYYFIPVFGRTTDDDNEDLRNYKRFLHQPESNITFAEWAQRFCQVYGENGQVTLAFANVTLFSDVIFKIINSVPMLFLFGEKSSGKGAMVSSIMSLWGEPQDQFMLGGQGSVKGFMRKLGQFSNAITWLDEYKNDIGHKAIESLKNIWDRIGYETGVQDFTNKTRSKPITSTAIISGQEMPNAEPALFSRCVLLMFKNRDFTTQEIEAFDELKTISSTGITTATLEIISQRRHVKKEFKQTYQEVSKAFRKAFQGQDIIERQIVNYSVIVSVHMILEKHLKMPFTGMDLYYICERCISRQRDMMRNANETQQFFEMLAYLISDGHLTDQDVHVTELHVKVRLVKAYPLYRDFSRRQGLKAIDKGSLTNYLQNLKCYEYEASRRSHRFPNTTNPTNALVFLHKDLEAEFGIGFQINDQDADSQHLNDNTNSPQPF
jgi:hypothetical protein